MKKFRFNTKVGTSRGLGAYRNKGSDYLELAPKYRTLYERGQSDVISASIDYSAIPSCCGSYMPTAKIWQEIDKSAYIWNRSAWLHADIEGWTRYNLERAKKVFDYLVKEHGMDYFNYMYTPVFYDNIGIGIMKDFPAFAQALMFDAAGKKSMELYNYAFRTLKDGRQVLYARTLWLKTFKVGIDIINYYKIARKRNFKKVYGF
jgi:hypothetical protein